MMGVLLAAVLISALLLVTRAAMSFGLALLGGRVPAWGPIRYALHAQMARRESADLDREYETLLDNHRLGGSSY
jgi:hypothetical protein